MSMDVTIMQRGLWKKGLPPEIVLGKELRVGTYNSGWRLEEGTVNLEDMICFLPEATGRGFSFSWSPHRKERAELRLLTPTGREEIQAFYRAVQRIVKHWHGTLEVDGTPTSLADWLAGQEDYIAFNTRALQEGCRDILKKEQGELCLFSARWPLYMGRDEAQQFLDSPEAFERWLHERQSLDVYYAIPGFFSGEGETRIGRYALSENCRSVFPKQGFVPFGTTDAKTRKPLECSRFEVALYSDTEKRIIGTISYEEMLRRFPAGKLSRYDERCLLFEPLDLQELRALLHD